MEYVYESTLKTLKNLKGMVVLVVGGRGGGGEQEETQEEELGCIFT